MAVWHRGPQKENPRDVACYVVSDAVVAGSGQIWGDGRIVTSLEIIPPYVTQALGISGGGADALQHCANLPKRTLDAPCLVALDAVSEAYGHFLIEMLFRILVARMAWPAERRMPYKILLHAEMPDWLLRILADEVGIKIEDLELFHPWHERIALHNALFRRQGSRIVSVGSMNFVQSEIGALRAHRNGNLTNKVDYSSTYSVDRKSFKAFLQAMCN